MTYEEKVLSTQAKRKNWTLHSLLKSIVIIISLQSRTSSAISRFIFPSGIPKTVEKVFLLILQTNPLTSFMLRVRLVLEPHHNHRRNWLELQVKLIRVRIFFWSTFEKRSKAVTSKRFSHWVSTWTAWSRKSTCQPAYDCLWMTPAAGIGGEEGFVSKRSSRRSACGQA